MTTPVTHNLVVPSVTRQEGDPLLCPFMSHGVILGIQPGALAGSSQQVVQHAIPVACAGAVCALWHRDEERCNLGPKK